MASLVIRPPHFQNSRDTTLSAGAKQQSSIKLNEALDQNDNGANLIDIVQKCIVDASSIEYGRSVTAIVTLDGVSVVDYERRPVGVPQSDGSTVVYNGQTAIMTPEQKYGCCFTTQGIAT